MTEAAVREEVRSWLSEQWDPERPLREWREILIGSGWACPTWPTEWFGRGLPRDLGAVVNDEFSRAGAVGTPIGVGMGLAAPTILDHGDDQLKERFLRGIVTGEDKWCQLFSEPGSGSDLAGLTCHAELVDDEWIVNGQKVWNTGAHVAKYGLLMARTDWDVPKHRGITYFVLPMKQDGVEVRPIKQMNGYSSFNEVFISDARIPADFVVGDQGDGWRVGLTTLAYERVGIGNIFSFSGATPKGRTAAEAAEEAAEYLKTYIWYPQRMGRPDLLRPHAKAMGRGADPVVRQKIAYVESLVMLDRFTKDRAKAAREAGHAPGPEGSIAKLVLSRIARAAADAHHAIGGMNTTVTEGPDAGLDGTAAEIALSWPAQSIAGGTDEVQLNIIGERVLGLPKEPQVDRDVAFREVRKNTAR